MQCFFGLCEIFPHLFPFLNPSVPLPRSATYSDMFSRTKMLPLAAAAYSSRPQECLADRFANATLKRQVNVICGPFESNDVCSGFTAVIHSDQAIIISFRGTSTFLQLVAEADYSVFHEKNYWTGGGYVSKFFYDGFMDLWEFGMKDDFEALRVENPTYKIWVTGHSLGGALASLAASYIISEEQVPSSTVQLVTFGQPRVGNVFYAMAHDRQMAYSFRVTHWRDIVPHIPPEYFELYYHHRSEAFYHLNMSVGANYTVCAENESRKCSDGLDYTTSISDHLHYFDVDVGGHLVCVLNEATISS
ncbi:Triacylglycerol lipase [Trichostrongylus colubriformis]|uniref:Triacylglycerol lipase n=1 Tax=Trichostrongylus colubriformis TaxID=6319 RepID=A0AAN8FHQ0_TRICO